MAVGVGDNRRYQLYMSPACLEVLRCGVEPVTWHNWGPACVLRTYKYLCRNLEMLPPVLCLW